MVSVLSACFPVPQRKFRHRKGERRRKDKVKGILREVQNRRLSSGTNRKVDSSAGREELKKKILNLYDQRPAGRGTGSLSKNVTQGGRRRRWI